MDNVSRKEIKYLISLEKYLRIKPKLLSFLTYDPHSSDEG